MLTALEIENFKGIGARQRIEFAPLTLLFGANSAGKSTILQALLYLHELIKHGDANVDRTELGGSVVELGGFERLVHQHDLSRTIVLRAEFTTPGSLNLFERDLSAFPFPDLDDEVESAWLELTVRHRKTAPYVGPVIERVRIGVNARAEPAIEIPLGAALREGDPLFARVNYDQIEFEDTAIGDAWTAYVASSASTDEGPFSGPVFAVASNRRSAVPSLHEALRIIPEVYQDPDDAALSKADREAEAAVAIAAAEQVRTFLEMLVLGTTAQLANFLGDTLYIGPLRAIPSRGVLYEHTSRNVSWADGLAAWDRLLADRLRLVEDTNERLRKLGAGCQVVVQQLSAAGADAEALAESHPDVTVRRLLLDTGAQSLVLPGEVGAGISQVLPVIVAALEARGGLTLVEQPEIHVHPALQVGLGDLLLEAALRPSQRRVMLVETHSEHLLLRIMRRMRQTQEATLPDGNEPVRPHDISVVLIEREGARTIARKMPLNERGELVKAWPNGFFEEGLREML